MTDETKPDIDVRAALQNILQQLQEEPQRYKLFGVWWWAIKALLRRVYSTDNLYMLGLYQDQDVAAMIPTANLQDTMRAALEEYAFNATLPHPASMVEAPEGDMVFIFDSDAEL
jgi:hypothetical protein